MIADKLGTMNRVLNDLEAKRNRLATGSFTLGLGNAIDETLKTTTTAIETMRGNRVMPGDINPWQRAIDDDTYFVTAWMDLAKTVESNLNNAIGYQDSYSVGDWVAETVVGAGAVIAEHVPSTNQATASLGFIAVACVAVAVIFVMK